MGHSPLASAIMIFLDAEEFIQEAIESVFAQTYENWELLLVDDGSTDASTTIASRCAERFPDRVRYLEHEGHRNQGMSASRNLGIHHTHGKYVAFLDADDVWLPHKLESQVAILEAQPEAGMVYGLNQYWYSWTGKPKDRERDFVLALGVEPDTLFQPPTLLTLFLRQKAAGPGTCSILVRREVLEAVGGMANSFRGLFEDQVLRTKILLSVPVFATDDCVSRYRQHPDSCCSLASGPEWLNARLAYLNWLVEYLSARGIEDKDLWRIVRRELRVLRHPHLRRLSQGGRQVLSRLKGLLRRLVQRTLPPGAYAWLRARWWGESYTPPAELP